MNSSDPRSLRVLLLFSSSSLGGAEVSLTRMATHSPPGVTYILASIEGKGPWREWLSDIQYTNVLTFGSTSDNHKPNYLSLVRLLLWIYSNRPDIIYVCGLRLSFFLRILKLNPKFPKLIHGVRWNPASNTKLDLSLRLVEKLLHPLVDLWITNSLQTKKTLVERCNIHPNKVIVAYNGVSLVPFTSLPHSNNNTINVVTIANLSPRKGHIRYLECITQIITKHPSAVFTFVGRDNMNGELQKQICKHNLSHCVRVEGFKHDVGKYLQEANVFVLPSLWGEGCPTAILEAYAHSLPVVAYDIDGISELVNHNEDGFLADLRLNNLSYYITKLLNNPHRALAMGAKGREKVEKYFTITSCSHTHLSAFQSLVDPT